MKFQAVMEHVVWISSIARNLEAGVKNSIDEVSDPTACQIGHWIEEHRSELTALPEFLAFDLKHKEMHSCVSNAVQFANESKSKEESVKINGEWIWMRRSFELIDAWYNLEKKLPANLLE